MNLYLFLTILIDRIQFIFSQIACTFNKLIAVFLIFVQINFNNAKRLALLY